MHNSPLSKNYKKEMRSESLAGLQTDIKEAAGSRNTSSQGLEKPIHFGSQIVNNIPEQQKPPLFNKDLMKDVIFPSMTIITDSLKPATLNSREKHE